MHHRCAGAYRVLAVAAAACIALATGIWLSTGIGSPHVSPVLDDGVFVLHVPVERGDAVGAETSSSSSGSIASSRRSVDGTAMEEAPSDDAPNGTHDTAEVVKENLNRIRAQQEAMHAMRARSYLASFRRVYALFWPTSTLPHHSNAPSPRVVAAAGSGSVPLRQAAMVLRAALLQQHLLAQHRRFASTHVADVTNEGCHASEVLWGLQGLRNASLEAYRAAAVAVVPTDPPQLILSTLGAATDDTASLSPRGADADDPVAPQRLTELYLIRMYRAHIDRERKQRRAFHPMDLNTSIPGPSVRRHDVVMVTAGTGLARDAEGVCVPADFANMETLQELPAERTKRLRPWSPETLRMALLVDLEIAITVAWEALVEASPSSIDLDASEALLPPGVLAHLSSIRQRAARDRGTPGATAGADDAVANRRLATVCMKPKLRAALQFSSQHQWMFRHFLPPFMEDDITDREHYESADRQMADVKLWATLNTKLTKIKGPNARNRPFFYTMGNVVLPSSRGGGSPQGYKGSVHMHLLRDERFIRIRDHRVHTRHLEPRFVVKSRRPLYLFPVLFASDNVGHVMFRYFSALALMDRLRMDRQHAIFAYTVLPSSLQTFADRNVYRAFYQGLHGPWLSVLSTHKAAESILDLAFRLTISGFDGIAQFHKGGGDMDKARKESHKALLPAVERMRNLSSQCYQLPHVKAREAAPAPAVRMAKVVVIRRRSRRILDDEDLVQHYIQLAADRGGRESQMAFTTTSSSGGSVPAETPLIDPTTGRRFEVLFVDYEDLTFVQQMLVTASADVLIGPIGAGQCWMMYMRPRSVVVELQIGPTMFCTGEGLNRGRMHCDYSKLSVAAGLHHIGFKTMAKVPCHPLKCDGIVNRTEFVALMGAAFCALGKRQGAASTCAVPRAPSSRY